MFSIFSCLGCHSPFSPSRTPLCASCTEALLLGRPLCSHCGEPCGDTCRSPWLEPIPYACASLYFGLGRTYDILNHWKRSPCNAFTRWLINAAFSESLCAWIALQRPQGLIAIPGEAPAALARAISTRTGIPILQARLVPAGFLNSRPIQKSKNLQERLSTPLRFELLRASAATFQECLNVMMVDDFMTSGKTFQAGFDALRANGVVRVCALAMAYRPMVRGNAIDLKSPRFPLPQHRARSKGIR